MRKLVLAFFLIAGCGASLEERKFQTFLNSFDARARQLRWMDEDPSYFLEGQIADLSLPRAQAGVCVLVVASRDTESVGQVLSLTVSYNESTLGRNGWRRPYAFAVFRMPDQPVNASVLVISLSGQGTIFFSAYEVTGDVCSHFGVN